MATVLAKTRNPQPESVFFARYPRAAIYKALLVLGILFAISIPAIYVTTQRTDSDEAFTVKGGNNAPLFSVRCTGMDNRRRCKPGATLVFKVNPPPGKSFFSAFGTNDSRDLTVWYYPADEAAFSPQVGNDPIVLTDGVVVGKEHEPGRYIITGIFTEKPVYRKDIRTHFSRGTDKKNSAWSVTKTHFEVY